MTSDEHGETGGRRGGSHGAALEPCVGRGVPDSDPGKGIAMVVCGAENNEEFEELVGREHGEDAENEEGRVQIGWGCTTSFKGIGADTRG